MGLATGPGKDEDEERRKNSFLHLSKSETKSFPKTFRVLAIASKTERESAFPEFFSESLFNHRKHEIGNHKRCQISSTDKRTLESGCGNVDSRGQCYVCSTSKNCRKVGKIIGKIVINL
jgi:hypothetical protein